MVKEVRVASIARGCLLVWALGCGGDGPSEPASNVPEDACPTDPDKVEPGVCGCGVPDVDQDADGIIDCVDNCPAFANPHQLDHDEDGYGTGCDLCPYPSSPDASGRVAICVAARQTCDPVPAPSCPGGEVACSPCPCAAALDAIREGLDRDPPGTGDPTRRADIFRTLDQHLLEPACRRSIDIQVFFARRMDRLAAELEAPVVEGVRVWMAYNHGFVVKTKSRVLAFDLTHGCESCWEHRLPESILDAIDVLFVSHRHGDHRDHDVIEALLERGRPVVVPSEMAHIGDVGMPGGGRADVEGLAITAHEGLHSVPVRIFEVVTPEGFRIVHTGDNETSATLPAVTDVDLLLLNGWVNESGTATPEVGIRRSVERIRPRVTLLGHAMEMDHEHPQTYAAFLRAMAGPHPTQLLVLAWGESLNIAP